MAAERLEAQVARPESGNVVDVNEPNTITPGTLTVATYGGFAPFAWREGDDAHGRDIDFLRAFAAHLGLKVEVQFFAFDRLWERPREGVADIAAAGISRMPSREGAGILWSAPYFDVQRALVIRAVDQHRYSTIADFAGRVIEVTPGSAAHLDAERCKPASTTLTYCHNLDDALQRLLNGEVDAFGTGDFGAADYVRRFPGQVAAIDIHAFEVPEQFAFVVRESSQLLASLNAFIHQHGKDYWSGIRP